MIDSFEYLNDKEITNIEINHADKIKWLSDILENYANQRIIEELEDIISNRTRLWTEELLGRIKQLKQETKR